MIGSTAWPSGMLHKKWRETNQEPSRVRSGHQISCCLVSLHFLCDIPFGHAVLCGSNSAKVVVCRGRRQAGRLFPSSVGTTIGARRRRRWRCGLMPCVRARRSAAAEAASRVSRARKLSTVRQTSEQKADLARNFGLYSYVLTKLSIGPFYIGILCDNVALTE